MALKKKKTAIYLVFVGILVYFIAQLAYFNRAYSPLQVLADARSEAKRLLKFMMLYHYQCNSTLSMPNSSSWVLCLEVDGTNLENKANKVAYSIGPTPDYDFEKMLVKNFSFSMNSFGPDLGKDSVLSFNNSRAFKLSIVPNDPADFSRNSFDSQTLNSVMVTLGHKYIDVLKTDKFLDSSDSHEFLFFLVKDDLLSKIGQLHITIYIDKVDDDYLYSWYRALYMLFEEAGFRLFHTVTNDQLCLQVTLMESCIYHLSWVKDPGPNTFIIYPPAQDGSEDSEIQRLADYIGIEEGVCSHKVELTLSTYANAPLHICRDEPYLQCTVIVVRTRTVPVPFTVKSDNLLACHVTLWQLEESGVVHVHDLNNLGDMKASKKLFHSLHEGVEQFASFQGSKSLYFDTPKVFWELITPLLNSGFLKNFYQIITDVDFFGHMKSSIPFSLRLRYSELKRISAHGFQIFESNNLNDFSTLHFQSNMLKNRKCCHRLNFLRI